MGYVWTWREPALRLLALSWSYPMKVIQIVPQEGLTLYAALVKKEAELR
jgi:hypothetical protein